MDVVVQREQFRRWLFTQVAHGNGYPNISLLVSRTNILAETVLRINMLLMITHYLTGLLFLFHLTKTQYGFMVARGPHSRTATLLSVKIGTIVRLFIGTDLHVWYFGQKMKKRSKKFWKYEKSPAWEQTGTPALNQSCIFQLVSSLESARQPESYVLHTFQRWFFNLVGSRDSNNCLQNKVILTIPCIFLLCIKKALQCVAISLWSRGFLTKWPMRIIETFPTWYW